ncbi:hypothetical protein [Rhodococcus pyridinivorans]|nr:hypothetical protein [Rhodococcus pyridinivorans]MCD2142345.1 hypothetical protein [Rhodococcus pyridinivorans]
MVNLTTLRTEVKDELEAAGIPTAGWADNRLPAPPCAIVSLAEPYLSPATEGSGSLECRFVAHLAVEVVAGRGPDEQVAAELDWLIRTAVLALLTGEYTGRVPGDGVPQLVDVRPYVAETPEESMTVGAYVSVNFPINMKES